MNWIKNTLLFFIAVLICLLITEFSVRKIFPSWFDVISEPYTFYKFDPILGWSNQANSHGGLFQRREFIHKIDTNSDGARDREFLPINEKLDILVLGDSFVWGVGSEYGDRFTEVLEKNPLINEARNFGVSGYGQIQEFLQLKNELVSVRGVDLIVLTICLSNDLQDNVSPFRYGYLKPYAEINSNGELDINGIPVPFNKKSSKEFSSSNEDYFGKGLSLIYHAFLRKFSPSHEIEDLVNEADFYKSDYELSIEQKIKINEMYLVFDKLIQSINNFAVTSKIPLVVVLAPTKYEVQFKVPYPMKVRDRIATILSRENIVFIDPASDLTSDDFWIDDGHWNKKGHKKIANAIIAYIKKSEISKGNLK